MRLWLIKIARLFIVLFLVTVLTFMLVNILPGEIEAIREELGLDQPVMVRYAQWLGGVFVGD
jgi:peptide/nickel transport system permease protein